jgi:hypothetical protein
VKDSEFFLCFSSHHESIERVKTVVNIESRRSHQRRQVSQAVRLDVLLIAGATKPDRVSHKVSHKIWQGVCTITGFWLLKPTQVLRLIHSLEPSKSHLMIPSVVGVETVHELVGGHSRIDGYYQDMLSLARSLLDDVC